MKCLILGEKVFFLKKKEKKYTALGFPLQFQAKSVHYQDITKSF